MKKNYVNFSVVQMLGEKKNHSNIKLVLGSKKSLVSLI